MSLILSDDLRHAVATEGTPLTLVDPATGQTYVLVSAAAFTSSDPSPDEAQSLARAQIPNARLLELARRHAPPESWRTGDEDLF
jgi:hypothetical protein